MLEGGSWRPWPSISGDLGLNYSAGIDYTQERRMTSDLVKKKMSSLVANKHGVRERIISLFGSLKSMNRVLVTH